MNTWLAISAGATFLLALAAFWAIWQNHNLQKRERKERLLNEIIEWAVEVTKWRPKKIFGEIIHTANRLELQHLMFSHIVEIMESFIEMRGENQYVSSVARKIDKNLEEGVDNLIEVLELKTELLAEWNSKLAEARNRVLEENEEGSYFLKAEELENQIEELALTVIEEATKIKTKDIGNKEENVSKESGITASNEPTIKDVKEHLERQDRQIARTQWQFPFSLGVSAMAVGLTFVGATSQIGLLERNTGLFVFFIGVAIVLLSLLYRYRKKS